MSDRLKIARRVVLFPLLLSNIIYCFTRRGSIHS